MHYKARKRQKLWKERPVCFVCNQTIDDYEDCTLEHIVPRSIGGTNAESNLAISHYLCNVLKGSHTQKDIWEKKLADRLLALDLLDLSPRNVLPLTTFPTIDSPYLLSKIGPGIISTVVKIYFPRYRELSELLPSSEIEIEDRSKLESILKYISELYTLEPDEIIKESLQLKHETIHEGWNVIFALLLIYKYMAYHEYSLSLFHAIWRLKQAWEVTKDHHIVHAAQGLLDMCFEMDKVLFKKVSEIYFEVQKPILNTHWSH